MYVIKIIFIIIKFDKYFVFYNYKIDLFSCAENSILKKERQRESIICGRNSLEKRESDLLNSAQNKVRSNLIEEYMGRGGNLKANYHQMPAPPTLTPSFKV